MSTVDVAPRPSQSETDQVVPPLIEGQRLDAETFHQRYEAMPPGTRAELIGGVVYMPSPMSYEHDRAEHRAYYWLECYEEATPGVDLSGGVSLFLDELGLPQPDAQLRILPECGGQTSRHGDYLAGAPELVVEVARATRYIDLGPKLADYERAGALEYVVRAFRPDEIIWHVRREGRLVAVPPDADGLYRSTVFPGLWLDPTALLAGDRRALRTAVERGLATPEHAAFVARLAEARRPT
jgi:Uma2 family endonuclease